MKKFVTMLSIIALLMISGTAHAQLFYKITGNGLSGASYLFGTHHLAPLSIIDKVGAADIVNQVDQVVGEIDMTQNPMALAAQMQSHVIAPADSTLTKVLGATRMANYANIFRKFSPMPGMELRMLDPMKPMAVNSIITLGLVRENMPEYNSEEQLDSYFQKVAQKQGKKIVPLETAEQQASFLYDSTSIADQAKDLIELFEAPGEAMEMAKSLNRFYAEQNLDSLYNLTKSGNSNPRMFEVLLYGRNDAWMQQLPKIMQQGPTLIAVGALHLTGERGLINQLRKAGYTVEEVR